MKLTWYGHSAFRVETGNAKILIDPFLTEQSARGARAGRGRPKASPMCS